MFRSLQWLKTLCPKIFPRQSGVYCCQKSFHIQSHKSYIASASQWSDARCTPKKTKPWLEKKKKKKKTKYLQFCFWWLKWWKWRHSALQCGQRWGLSTSPPAPSALKWSNTHCAQGKRGQKTIFFSFENENQKNAFWCEKLLKTKTEKGGDFREELESNGEDCGRRNLQSGV